MFKRRDFSKRVIFAIMGQPRVGLLFIALICVIPTDECSRGVEGSVKIYAPVLCIYNVKPERSVVHRLYI